MKECKIRREGTLKERIPGMKAVVEDYFDPITGTEEFKGSDLYVVGKPKGPVFTRIVADAVEYSDKEDKLTVNFGEADPTGLAPEDPETAGGAVSAKNDFLLETTGRDAKSRRDSMRRAVENDAPDV